MLTPLGNICQVVIAEGHVFAPGDVGAVWRKEDIALDKHCWVFQLQGNGIGPAVTHEQVVDDNHIVGIGDLHHDAGASGEEEALEGSGIDPKVPVTSGRFTPVRVKLAAAMTTSSA